MIIYFGILLLFKVIFNIFIIYLVTKILVQLFLLLLLI